MLYTPAFFAMFTANLCIVASFGAFFLFPLFITHHGGGEEDIGIIMGAFAMASALCRPWISEMIDRYGPKRCYSYGCLSMALFPLLYLPFSGELSSFYLPLLALRIAHGVSLAVCFTAVFTYIAAVIPPGRLNEGFGMFGMSGLTGLALGPILGEMVLKSYGFAEFFLAAAALAGVGFALQTPLSEKGLHPQDVHSPSFFSLLRRRKNLVVGLLSFLFGFGLAATGNFVTPLAEERALPIISVYYLAYSMAAVGIRFIGGRVADRVGENRMLPWALTVTGVGIFALVLVQGPITFALAGLLAGSGHGLLFPLLNTLAIRNESPEIRGKLTGIFTGGIDLGAFIGAVMLGFVGKWGGLETLFTVGGTALILGLWIFRFRVERKAQ